MLPGIDGYQVCRELRQQLQRTRSSCSPPRARSLTRCSGLELGADDYIIKPFDSKELVARVKAVLRRYQPAKTGASQTKPAGKIRGIPGSGSQPYQLFRGLLRTNRSTCRQRSWSFCTSLPPLPIRYLPANSCSTTSGAMNTSGTPAR